MNVETANSEKFGSLLKCVENGDVEDLRAMVATADLSDLEALQRTLRAAIYADDFEKVSVLLDAGAQPDSSAMLRAAQFAQEGILAQLLSAGGDPNAREWHLSPLIFAVEQKSTAKVSMLLDAGATPSSSAMFEASTLADPSILRQLLAAGGDPNGGEKGARPLHIAAVRGNTATLNCLLEAGADPNMEGEGTFPLHWACFMGNTEAVGQLLAAGADPNAKCAANHSSKSWPSPAYYAGDAPIDLIYSNSSVGTLEVLLKAGVDPNHKSDASGLSILHHAAMVSEDAFIAKLLEAGADPNQASLNGDGPLHGAAVMGRADVFSTLMAAGADPNRGGVDGATALHRAAFVGDEAIVAKLLDAGLHPDVVDNNGNTPLQYAARRAHTEVVEALLTAGADPHHANQKGRTALHAVCSYDAEKVDPTNLSDTARMLLEAGADPNARDNRGETPLFKAAAAADEYGEAVGMSIDLIENLVKKGADILAKDGNGKTASFRAFHQEVHTFLVTAEAQARQQLLEAKLPAVNEWAPPKRQGNDGPRMVIGGEVWNPRDDVQAQPVAAQQAPRHRMRL